MISSSFEESNARKSDLVPENAITPLARIQRKKKLTSSISSRDHFPSHILHLRSRPTNFLISVDVARAIQLLLKHIRISKHCVHVCTYTRIRGAGRTKASLFVSTETVINQSMRGARSFGQVLWSRSCVIKLIESSAVRGQFDVSTSAER